ncbi:MAG TPA: DUF2784 family protein [Acidobacteriota bacterium]|nr:DUF2784 family protein [Acidobacteriota bacterium]
MLQVANALFIIGHLCIIIFTLFGWIPAKTRRLHFYIVLITAFSWVVLGFWFGFGYCFFTDWHWMVRRKMGIDSDPRSFLKLLVDFLTGTDVDAVLIDAATAATFALIFTVSVYLNVWKRGIHDSNLR